MLVQPFGYNSSGTATGRLLKLGQYYQGGYVAYLTGNYPTQTGLIIAPVQISASMTWPNIGGVVTPIDQGYGFGFSNTQAAFVAGYTTDGIGTCWNYSNDGYTDWFMPSADELQLVIQNSSYIPYTLTALTYHASSAYGPNPGNNNYIVDVATATKSTGAHSDARGVLACRYITT